MGQWLPSHSLLTYWLIHLYILLGEARWLCINPGWLLARLLPWLHTIKMQFILEILKRQAFWVKVFLNVFSVGWVSVHVLLSQTPPVGHREETCEGSPHASTQRNVLVLILHGSDSETRKKWTKSMCKSNEEDLQEKCAWWILKGWRYDPPLFTWTKPRCHLVFKRIAVGRSHITNRHKTSQETMEKSGSTERRSYLQRGNSIAHVSTERLP